MKKLLYLSAILVGSSCFFQSCAPVFSEMQSARTVGKKNIEVMPSGTLSQMNESGESEHVQNHIGLQAAYGITEDFDIRLRYERLWLPAEGYFKDGADVVGIAPKYSFIKDRLATSLLVGRGLGEGSDDTWEIHPTVIFTQPIIEDKFDLNVSSKYILRPAEDMRDFLALNVGLAIGSDISHWSARPEFGILGIPGESGFYTHLSMGLSYVFKSKRAVPLAQ